MAAKRAEYEYAAPMSRMGIPMSANLHKPRTAQDIIDFLDRLQNATSLWYAAAPPAPDRGRAFHRPQPACFGPDADYLAAYGIGRIIGAVRESRARLSKSVSTTCWFRIGCAAIRDASTGHLVFQTGNVPDQHKPLQQPASQWPIRPYTGRAASLPVLRAIVDDVHVAFPLQLNHHFQTIPGL